MENKSHPKSKKVKKHLTDHQLSTTLNNFLEKSSTSTENISYIESYLNFKSGTYKNTGPSRKQYLNARKKVDHDLNTLKVSSKNIFRKQSYHKELKNEDILSSVHDIKKLPSAILKCYHLNYFSSCQLIVHEKGNLSAQSFCNKTKNNSIAASQFNKFFQTVKKSKSNLFTPSNLDSNNIDLLGHIIASTFESNQFRWIILLGNNDFFPPEEAIIENVIKEVSQLAVHIESIFFHCKYDDKIENIINVLDILPVPLLIKDKRDAIVYQNNSYDEVYDGEFEDYTIEVSELEDGNQLCVYYPSINQSSADVYHHYKVKLLGELLNTLKHELSNPLFGLHLSSEIMATQTSDTETKELISDIATRADRCQTIIKNFSKLYGDQEASEVNIIELIQETITLTKSETRGVNKVLKNNIKEENQITRTHPTSLSQIIFNLIINASQAIQQNETKNSSDEIIIDCNYINNKYEISVIDTGPGVPTHLQDTIFDTFFTTKKEGTGLGLSICANLINKMNGIIKYSLRADKKGSVFTIIFQ